MASFRIAVDRCSLRTIGDDESSCVRDLASGRILRRNPANPLGEQRVWSPNERSFATLGVDGGIHLWDTMRGEETHQMKRHRGTVRNVAFSPDARWLFSAGEDATLQWWDVRTGQRIERFQEESTDHVCYSLSHDGRLLAWTCGERSHLWDLSARKEVRVFRGHAFGTRQVELEREGTVLVSIGTDDSTVRCWDIRTGQEFRAIETGNKSYQVFSTRLFRSGDGRVLSYGGKSQDSGLALLQPSTGIEICRTTKEVAFEISPDGKIVAVPGDKLAFRELISGGVLTETPVVQREGIRWMRFSPDGRRLITAGRDGTYILWDWRRLAGLVREGSAKVGDPDVETAWQDLASPQARKGYRALFTLADAGDKAVSLLRKHLRPADADEQQRWRKYITDLDDSDFTVREKASQKLMLLGVEAELFLRRAAAEKVPLEVRRRLELILASDDMKRPSAESLRAVRAVQVLEIIGTPAARELLTDWSRGDADAWLTQEARSALYRHESPSLQRRR